MIDSKYKLKSRDIDVLIIGGGRWGQVYIDEILRLKEIRSKKITILSRRNSKDLITKYNSEHRVNICKSESQIMNNIYDLAIIAGREESHAEDAKLICKNAKNILIEKPVFQSMTEFNSFAKMLPGMATQPKINVSCPYLFSGKVANQDRIQDLRDNEYKLIGLWHEPESHPKGHRLDKDVKTTAISHLLPLLCLKAKINYKDLAIQKIEPSSLIFKPKKNSCCKFSSIEISYKRGQELNFTKQICIVSPTNRTITYNLMSNKLKKEGMPINFAGNTIQGLSPLQSQIIYCLSETEYFDRLLSIYAYKDVMKILDSVKIAHTVTFHDIRS